jgi:hypothetical protein
MSNSPLISRPWSDPVDRASCGRYNVCYRSENVPAQQLYRTTHNCYDTLRTGIIWREIRTLQDVQRIGPHLRARICISLTKKKINKRKQTSFFFYSVSAGPRKQCRVDVAYHFAVRSPRGEHLCARVMIWYGNENGCEWDTEPSRVPGTRNSSGRTRSIFPFSGATGRAEGLSGIITLNGRGKK